MERLRLSPAALASIAASLIVLASLTGSYIVKFLSAPSLSIGQGSGALASACTPAPESDKVYFVSCGGTF